MPNAATLRVQIESALSSRIPSALTPVPRIVRPIASTGIAAMDELLDGGLPLGAITEIVGPECSGRTALALSFAAQITAQRKVCAWIDVSNALHPESAAASGVCLSRLLWVRCGHTSSSSPDERDSFSVSDRLCVPPAIKKGLRGGGFGPHPRTEVKGLSEAVSGLLRTDAFSPRCAEPPGRDWSARETLEPATFNRPQTARQTPAKPLTRIEQALRVTDLLLQAGGFGAIVLDFGSVTPEHATRVQSAIWFRYRAAAERTQASILLLTQHNCAQSSAELVLQMKPGDPAYDKTTVFTGFCHQAEIVRERFSPATTNVVPLRKPPQSDRRAAWQSRTSWAGRR